MTDDETTPGGSSRRDLRTVINRLVDLQRKCRSVESRSNEAMEIEQRIGAVLDRVRSDDDTDAEPIPYAALARELWAVERFFESNGFLGIAKEVAHVERALMDAAGPAEPVVPDTPIVSAEVRPDRDSDTLDDDTEEVDADLESRWTVPRPVAAVLAVFVLAVLVCVVVIVNRDRLMAVRVDTPPAAPTARPSPTRPPPTATPVPARDQAEPAPGAVLAEAVGDARLALADDDIERAMDSLSRAALVDPDHATVLATARQIMQRLLDNADAAAEAGLWDIAELTLARAGRIATRFGLDHTPIERAAHRYERMDRFRIIAPSDTRAITGAAGHRVTVQMRDGSTRDSVIKGVADGALLLDEDTEVRGGAMYYVDEVPLADIDFLKVWED